MTVRFLDAIQRRRLLSALLLAGAISVGGAVLNAQETQPGTTGSTKSNILVLQPATGPLLPAADLSDEAKPSQNATTLATPIPMRTSGNKVLVVQPAAGPFGGFKIGGRTFFGGKNKKNTLEFRPSRNIPRPPPSVPEKANPAQSTSPLTRRSQTINRIPRNPVRSSPATGKPRTAEPAAKKQSTADGWVARDSHEQFESLRDARATAPKTTSHRATADSNRAMADASLQPQGPVVRKNHLAVPEAHTPKTKQIPLTDPKPQSGESKTVPAADHTSSKTANLRGLNAPSDTPSKTTRDTGKNTSDVAKNKKLDVAKEPESQIAKASPDKESDKRPTIRQPDPRDTKSTAKQKPPGSESQYVGTEPRRIERDYSGTATNGIKPNSRSLRMKSGIERVLQYFYSRPEIADKRSNWGMMHSIMVYGVDTRILSGRKSYSAIGWIAGNNYCRGKRLLLEEDNHIKVDSGIGLQGHQAQFLCVLSLCNVPADYPLYAADTRYTVRDLIKQEMAACKSGEELTFTLIGLAHYLDTNATWTASDGQRWDFSRLIREELSQPIVGSACGGTHRLMGFGHALRKRRAEGRPINGQWARAEKFTQDFVRYAYQLQNRDGSMSTHWFEGREDNGDVDRKIQTTGHIVEWLLTVTPDSELQNTRLVSAVSFLLNALHRDLAHDWQIGPKGHALRSLAMFHDRVYDTGTAWRRTGVARSSSTLSR